MKITNTEITAGYIEPAEQNIELNKPVSRRKLGMLLEIDDRCLKDYESYGIITGIKSPGYKNTRYIPALVLRQISDYVQAKHADKQRRFETARQHLEKYNTKGTNESWKRKESRSVKKNTSPGIKVKVNTDYESQAFPTSPFKT